MRLPPCVLALLLLSACGGGTDAVVGAAPSSSTSASSGTSPSSSTSPTATGEPTRAASAAPSATRGLEAHKGPPYRLKDPGPCNDTGVVGYTPAAYSLAPMSCAAGWYINGAFYSQSCAALKPESVSSKIWATGTGKLEAHVVRGVSPNVMLALNVPGGACGDNDKPTSTWSMLFGPSRDQKASHTAICDNQVPRKGDPDHCKV